jgi:hypothetical protein
MQVNEITRSLKVPCYIASLHGLCGIIFVDLIEHTTIVNSPLSSKDNIKHIAAPTKKKELYCPLGESFLAPYGKTLKPRQARKVSPLLPLSFCTIPNRNH